jgi:streptogramin lyase
VTVNGISASGGTASGANTANWSVALTLSPGANTITVVARDTLNNPTQQQITVTYNPPLAPSVTSPTTTSITSTTATLGGTVTSTGGASLSKRGVLYALTSINSNPTLGGPGVTEIDDTSATTGTFSMAITGLTAGTDYSFVAFASNSVGTTYTIPVSAFTTLAGCTSALGTTFLLEGPSSGTDSDLVIATGAWTATSNASWLHTSSSGTGNGLAVFTFDANSGATRTGTLTIAGQILTVTQAGSTYVAASPVTTLVGGTYCGVAVDCDGNVYIADFGNNVIKKLSVTSHTVSTLISSGLNGPNDVAVDNAGNIYIADEFNNAIKKWNITTQQVSTLVSSGLRGPSGVAVDGAGNVYIADTYNNAIKEWNAATQTVSTLVASGLSAPRDVAVDSAGNVYIADSWNNAIKEWNARTKLVSTLVSSGLNEPALST